MNYKKYVQKMRNFTRHLCDWSVPSRVLLYAAFGLSVLSAASCRTQRAATQTVRTDSLSWAGTAYETLETVREAVAGDTLSLTIRMEEMWNLPEGASFSQKAGRTRLNVKRQGEDVVVEAETDSIGRETRHYERKARDNLLQRVGNALHHEASATMGEPQGGGTARHLGSGSWMLVGIVGTIVAILLTKRLFK